MSRELRTDYSQFEMFPRCLEDWLSAEHPTRFLREFVDSLHLEALGFASPESLEGRPQYARDVLLKVWLYGYMHRIRSTRALESACREHVSLLWLTGNRAPDHNTLWRFWRDHREAMRAVFLQVVQVAWDAGLIETVLHAVDGTKVAVQSSRRKGLHSKSLKRMLGRVEREIAALEKDLEAAEGQHDPAPSTLPDHLRDRQALRQTIRDSLDRLEHEDREHLQPQEPEAQMMQCEGVAKFCYNGQTVVDASHGLIVAQDVVSAGSDNHQLVPVLEQVHEQLGTVAQTTVADGGYYSGQTLSEAQAKGYEVLVHEPKDKLRGARDNAEFASSQFRYEAQRDVCVCPLGKELTFVRERQKPGRGYAVREYRCQVFRQCPRRFECSRDRQGRRIEISPHHQAVQLHRARLQEPKNQELLKRRSAIVEPPFAWIKQHHQFRRFTVQGLDGARTQWALVCAAVNLKKLYAYWRSQQLVFT